MTFLFSVPRTARTPVGCLVSHFSEASSMADYHCSLGREGESQHTTELTWEVYWQ